MKRIVWILLVITAVFLSGLPAVQSADDKTVTPTMITVEEDGLLVHWQVPAPQFRVEDFVSHVEIAGYTLTAEPGDYLLPLDAKLLAVPADAQPTFEVVALQQSVQPLTQPPAIAPAPAGVVRDAAGVVIGGDFQAVPDANPQPPALVRLEEAGTMRGVRLMRLTLTPVRPDDDVFRVANQVTVRVRFNQSDRMALLGESLPMANTAVSDTLLQTVQTMVVNPQQVNGLESRPAASFLSRTEAGAASVPTAAIEVVERGITAVTYADLAAAGFPVGSANPQNLHLKHDGVEVPIEWIGDGDTQFEANEEFLFYADPQFSRWLNEDNYLLTADNVLGTRVITKSVSLSSLSQGQVWLDTTIEVNNLYTPDCLCGPLPLGRDGDRFVWDFMTPDDDFKKRDYAVSLPSVNTGVNAELTVWLIGYTDVDPDPDHKVNVSWNGTYLGSVSWDGKTAVTTTLTIPAAKLQSSNQMTLNLVNPPGVTVNGIWFDAAQVQYARNGAQTGNSLEFTGNSTRRKYSVGLASTAGLRIYDVTNTAVPQKLTGWVTSGNTVTLGDSANGTHAYSVANQNGIKSPEAVRLLKSLNTESTVGADYIIISPTAFRPALNSLIALRQSQGLQVVVEDVQAIYDQYAGGFPVPEAIHDYLADAYANWNPVPAYVLLVGDASFDPKQYRAASTQTWVAPFFMEADPWIGEVPVDNRYVTFDGGNDDILPDMIIGRLPVNSLGETQTVVNKIVQYETNPAFGVWNGRIPFVADNQDGAGNFATHSDNLIDQFVSAPWSAQSLYLDVTHQGADNTHDALLNSWNQGSGILFYNGHSSRHQWAAERVFHLDDVASLSNGARLPIVLQMTCLTGSYHIPDLVTLDEELLRHESGGAVAVWGATGLGVATGHNELSAGFLQTIIVEENLIIGQAVLAGKLNLKSFHRDLLDTFTLLGDPYLHMNVEMPENQLYLPTVAR